MKSTSPLFVVVLRLASLAFMLFAVEPRLAAQSATFVSAQTSLGTGFGQPMGVAVDSAGNVYVADHPNNRVVKISAANGAQTTIGTGLNAPSAVALDSFGDLFISDAGNNRVVVVPADGGEQFTVGASGLKNPDGIAVDGAGNLYIVDNGNARVLKVWADGSPISTVGSGFANVVGVAVDGKGNVYISDNSNGQVVKVSSGGTQTTVASGLIPSGLAVDAAGNLFIAVDGGVMEEPAIGGAPENAVTGLGYALAVAVDNAGRLYIAISNQATVTEVLTGSVDFGGVLVSGPAAEGHPRSSKTLALTFNTAGTEADVSVLGVFTLGAPNEDFVAATGGTCGVDTTNPLCTVNIAFTPSFSGLRQGAVELGDEKGNILATVNLYGTGLSPQISFTGVAPSLIGSGLKMPSAVAVDGLSDVFIADTLNNRVVLRPPSGTAQSTVGTGLVMPSGVAVDGAGNVYVAELKSASLVKIAARTGKQTTVGGGLSAPEGIAIDGAGDILVADSGNNRVVRLPANGGEQSTVGTGLASPEAVAVDAAGDVFIADTGNHRVVEVPANGGAQTTVGIGLSKPEGVAVDAAGDVFISDSGNNHVVEAPAGGGAEITLASGLNAPEGIAVDAEGNLFIADTGNNRALVKVRTESPTFSFAPRPSFLFPPIAVGKSDLTLTMTLQNAGNMPLEIDDVVYPPAFPVAFDENGPATLCIGDTTLAPGQTCVLWPEFTPPSPGAINEEIAIGDNSLNPLVWLQQVALSGTGVGAQSIVFSPPASVTFGAAPLNLSAYARATSGLPVSFKIVSGPAKLAGTVVTFTGAGSVVIEASQAGNSSYGAASPVSKTITVAKATPAIKWAVPAAIVYGTALSAKQLDATSTVAGKFVYLPAAGTVLAVGSHVLSVTFTPAVPANYLIAKASVTIVVNKATLTVAPKNMSIAFGAAIPAFTSSSYTVTGLVNGDKAATAYSGVAALKTTAVKGSPSNSYPIHATAGKLKSVNYSFAFGTGTLTITKAAVTVKAKDNPFELGDGQMKITPP